MNQMITNTPLPSQIVRTSSARLPTRYGNFTGHAFEMENGQELFALVMGNPADTVMPDGTRAKPPLVRFHSVCLTGDVFRSLRCECGEQLDEAQQMIAAEGRGVILYFPDHEGRGIGLVDKLRAYEVQDRMGLDTLDANRELDLPDDARGYDDGMSILHYIGVQRTVRLLTNNPKKIAAVEAGGFKVQRVELWVEPNDQNETYVKAKQQRMDHIGVYDPAPTTQTPSLPRLLPFSLLRVRQPANG